MYIERSRMRYNRCSFCWSLKSSGKNPEKLRQTQSTIYVNKISGLDTPFKDHIATTEDTTIDIMEEMLGA